MGLHSNGNNADIFYAKSATALAADTVTATYGGTSSNASLWIFSVAGENFATPFDPNGSVPAATQQNFGSHATIGTTITTNKHRDLVFNVLCATQGAFNSNPTPPTGYSVFFPPVNYLLSNTSERQFVATSFANVGSLLSSSSISYGLTGGSSFNNMLTDVIQASGQ